MQVEMVDYNAELVELFKRWVSGNNSLAKRKGVVGVEEAPPAVIPKVSPKYVCPSMVPLRPTALGGLVEMDPWAARGHRSFPSRGGGVRFHP